MNDLLKQHLIKALNEGIRYDGRKLLEFRKVTLEYDPYHKAEGSARVKIGDTDVIVGVKLSIETPYPDTQDSGNLMVNAELLPLSSPDFEPGPPSVQAVEVARLVDRGVRESKAIDTKKLCIEKGEKVWGISIDICPINTDGSLIDAASLAAIAALSHTRFPKYDGNVLDYKQLTKEKLPLHKMPLAVTVFKIDSILIVDPTPEEECVADARLTTSITEDGQLCAMQKGGDAPLTIEEVDKMVGIAMDNSQELRKVL